jgi:hypothetical protein
MTYKCRYCQKDFARETTLASHLCENKRRMLAVNDKQNRIAYQSWLLFRRLTISNVKHDKPYEDFIANRYFTGFMKLAKHIIDLGIEDPEGFVKFIVMNSVPMHKWHEAVVYESYVKDRTKKETVERAVERSVLNMKAWSERTGQAWEEYFQRVNAPDAVQDIRMGRISPWCTFATDQGSRLIDRLEPGQIQQLIEYIEPQSWRARVMRQRQDAQWVQHVFNEAKIK